MSKQISYTHWIYFDTDDQATASLTAFEAIGGSVDSEEAASGDEWYVTVTLTHAIDQLATIRDAVRQIARQFGGRYDGGEAGPL